MNKDDYIVSSLKYRPQNFEDVVGQHHVTDILKNAIKNNHIPKAILFCGSRGTGKTTCARILAREITKKFSSDSDLDFSFNIFELDAASNNSVDDIRRLIEQVQFPPQKGEYKVYIIDEVHMLSTSAFNAFLKTLEEPPKHAIFILATTEKQKIIPTILSRCQIFDFKKISNDDITNHLKNIAQKENILFEEEALFQISKKAEGGLRDALSIFDKIATLCEGNITLQKTNENLNILDYDYYFKILDFLYNGDLKNSILIFNEIINKGFDGKLFISGLASHIRDIMVAKYPDTLKLIDVSSQIQELYKKQASYIDSDFIIEALDICEKTELNYRNYHNQKLLIEINLMKLAHINESKKKNLTDLTEYQNQEISDKKQNSQNEVISVKKIGNPILSLKKEYEDKSILDIYKNVKDENLSRNYLSENIIKNTEILSQEKLDEFIETIKNQNKIIFTILKNSSIDLEKNNINITTKNNTSKSKIEENKNFILDYFSDNHNIVNLNVNIFVEQNVTSHSEDIIYGNDQKWKYLISKNNLLERLIKNYDFDF